MEKIKWGIVGCGRIADKFCQDMPYVNNGSVVAVAARDKARALRFAKDHQVDKAYQGYGELFADPEIDIVYIATPHPQHFENTRDALLAGKHVLCEKPFTVGSEQSRQLIALAKEKNLFLMEAMWTYFLPAMEKAKQWLDDGRIGTLKHIKCDFGYPIPYNPDGREYAPSLAGGCLLDMGIYPIAIAQYFSEQTLSPLFVTSHYAPNGVEDEVTVLANSGAVLANLAASFQCRLGNTAYLIGSHGHIVIPDAFRASQCLLYRRDDLLEHYQHERQTIGLNFEAEHAGHCILQGLMESPVMTHQRSLDLQGQMELVQAASKKS